MSFLKKSCLSLVCLGLSFASLSIKAAPAPLSSIARLSFSTGATSFLPAGEKKWVRTNINYPLSTGDRVWVADLGFLELQLNNLTLRLDRKTSLKFLNLNQKTTQLQLSTGSMILKVARLNPGQLLQVGTPNLAFSINRPGAYRIFVDDLRKTTTLSVLAGSGKAYAARAAYQLNAGKSCTFGLNLRTLRCTPIPLPDAFERMSRSREQVLPKVTTRYVSSNMIGYEDLDRYGRWTTTRQYGNIWTPTHVAPNWAPYRQGRWVWSRQWGWTWVDAEPWGFAPSHYGRWVFFAGRWSWVPGPRHLEPVYAPALVVFVGGNRFNLTLSSGRPGIAWFPLGPGELYVPPVRVSNNYFVNVNRSNTTITNINNIQINQYTNQNLPNNYKNMNAPNAVTAVPTESFKQSQPVSKALQPVPKETILTAPKNPVATVVPDSQSVSGAAAPAQAVPPKEVLNQPAVLTEQPAAAPLPFAEEQKLLEKNPGEPLPAKEDEVSKPAETKDGTQAAPTQVELVNPEQTAKPVEESSQAPAVTDKPIETEKPATTEAPASPIGEKAPPADNKALPEGPSKAPEKIPTEEKPPVEEKAKPEAQDLPEAPAKPEEQIQPEETIKPDADIKPESRPNEAPNKNQELKKPEVQIPEDQIQPEEPSKPRHAMPAEEAPSTEQLPPEDAIKPETNESIQPQELKPEEAIRPEENIAPQDNAPLPEPRQEEIRPGQDVPSQPQSQMQEPMPEVQRPSQMQAQAEPMAPEPEMQGPRAQQEAPMPEPQMQAGPQMHEEPQMQPGPQMQAEPQPQFQPEPEPEPEPQTQPEPQAQPEPQPEPQPQAAPQPQFEPQAQAQAEPQVQAQMEPSVGVQPQ